MVVEINSRASLRKFPNPDPIKGPVPDGTATSKFRPLPEKDSLFKVPFVEIDTRGNRKVGGGSVSLDFGLSLISDRFF